MNQKEEEKEKWIASSKFSNMIIVNLNELNKQFKNH
jgi:hypothetical protein